MIDILTVLKAILKDIEDDNKAVTVINDTHFMDTLSGVEFHLYDEYFQMTRGEEEPVAVSSFTKDEQDVIMEIKELITPMELSKAKKEDYNKYLISSRSRFADWYLNPKPVSHGIVADVDAKPYIRR